MPRDLFAKPALPQTAGHIIGWWESRRLYYNAVLLLMVIVISALAIIVPGSDQRRHLDNAWSMFVVGFFLLMIPANIWYTGGWVVDLFLKKVLHQTSLGFGPWALGLGIAFSLLFMALIYSMFFGIFTHGIRGF